MLQCDLAGAAFGDVAMSLFVAGTAFGEIWIDSRSEKCCNFQLKMRCRGGKIKLCERTGAVLQFHGRIILESSAIVNDASIVFGILECNSVRLEGDACCSVHCKRRFMCTRITAACHFTWQAQYLVTLLDDICCSAD